MVKSRVRDPRPTVILGVNEMALAAARDLAARGIPVFAVQPGAGAKPSIAYSRCLRHLRGPALELPDAVVEYLRGLAKQLGVRPVLLPVLDDALLLVHEYREALLQYFDFFVWDSPLLPEIGSKTGLSAVAARYGLPTPRSIAPRDRSDIEAAAGELRFPCIVKPEYTNAWWTQSARELGLNRKAIEVNDVGELLDVHERSARIGSSIVVQEKVVGPDAGHMSYMACVPDTGKPVGEVVVNKHRVYPPRFGVACYAETTLTEDAIRGGRDIVGRIGYRGFVSVQFKRDERDGKLYLLEINLRLPLAVQLPISAGLSYPFYYYCASLGQEIDAPSPRLGQRWMSFSRDRRGMRVHVREGNGSWWKWFIDVLRMPAFALFRVDDPLPACLSAAHTGWAAFRGRVSTPFRRQRDRGEVLP